MSWDVDSQSSYGQANIFLYMNIDYDFDGNALLGFHIKSVPQQSGQTVSFSYKYSNAALTVFSSTKNDYDAYFQPEYDALQAMISAAIDLQADYTTAYTNAMNLVNSAA